jgi:hypothetical protein
MVLTASCLLLPEIDLGAVDDAGLSTDDEMVDDLGEGPPPHSGADDAASLGEQGRASPIARVMVERSTPNQLAGTSCAAA